MFLILFIVYLLFFYFFISKKLINIYSIVLLYILFAYYIGLWTFETSQNLVTSFDTSFINSTILLFNIAYFFLILSIITTLTAFKKTSYQKKTQIAHMRKINIMKYVSIDIPFHLIIIVSIPIIIVFVAIYVPILQENISIAKYYQDRISEFIKYRPLYTLSINFLSVFLFIQLVNFIIDSNYTSFKLLKILFIVILLLASGKRGQLFFPIFIVFFSFLMHKKKYFSIIILFTITFFIGSLLRMHSIIDIFEVSLIEIYKSFSSSFFVSIRELTRLLSFFDNHYLYGLTYLADFSSFIPTKINPIKEEYNYMRYITYLSGENPDLFGGMRATYIGEAFINFGIYGVILISIFFGFLLVILQNFIDKTTYYQTFEYYLVLFWVAKMIALPFFENGSAMFLFFIITVLAFIIVYISIKFKASK